MDKINVKTNDDKILDLNLEKAPKSIQQLENDDW